jgi:biopolymer transport protein ExbB/TolQ
MISKNKESIMQPCNETLSDNTNSIFPQIPIAIAPDLDDSDAKGSPTSDITPWLQSLFDIVIIAGSFACILYVFGSPGTWIHAFFFQRGPVQWLSTILFVFAGKQLTARWRHYRMESNSLNKLENSEDVMEPGGMVIEYVQNLTMAVRNANPLEIQEAASHLTELSANRLEERGSTVNDIIGILPLVGFTGTVFGLTRGLYQTFLTEQSTTQSFAIAIATAFDTTLLALFLTIILYIGHTLLRKREFGLLEKLTAITSQRVEQCCQAARNARHQRVMEQQQQLQLLVDSTNAVHKIAASTNESITTTIQHGLVNVTEEFLERLDNLTEPLFERLLKTTELILERQHDTSVLAAERCTAKLSHATEEAVTKIQRINSPVIDCLDGLSQSVTDLGRNNVTMVTNLEEQFQSVNESLDRADAQQQSIVNKIGQNISSQLEMVEENTRNLITQPRRFVVTETIETDES